MFLHLVCGRKKYFLLLESTIKFNADFKASLQIMSFAKII